MTEPTPDPVRPTGPSRSALLAGTVIVVATIAAYVYLEHENGDTVSLLAFVAPLAAALFIVRVADNLKGAVDRAVHGQQQVKQAVAENTSAASEARVLFETNRSRIEDIKSTMDDRWRRGTDAIEELRKAIAGLAALHAHDPDHEAKWEKIDRDVAALTAQVAQLTVQVAALTPVVSKLADAPLPPPPTLPPGVANAG